MQSDQTLAARLRSVVSSHLNARQQEAKAFQGVLRAQRVLAEAVEAHKDARLALDSASASSCETEASLKQLYLEVDELAHEASTLRAIVDAGSEPLPGPADAQGALFDGLAGIGAAHILAQRPELDPRNDSADGRLQGYGIGGPANGEILESAPIDPDKPIPELSANSQSALEVADKIRAKVSVAALPPEPARSGWGALARGLHGAARYRDGYSQDHDQVASGRAHPSPAVRAASSETPEQVQRDLIDAIRTQSTPETADTAAQAVAQLEAGLPRQPQLPNATGPAVGSQKRVLAYFAEHHNEIITPVQVASAMGWVPDGAHKILSYMCGAGLIARVERGRYVSLLYRAGRTELDPAQVAKAAKKGAK